MIVEMTRYDRLARFFDILASGDRSRYQYARTIITSDTHSVVEQSKRDLTEEVPQLSSNIDSLLRDQGASVLKSTAKSSGLFDSAGTPTVDAKEFTFKMPIYRLCGMNAFKKMVEAVLRESQTNFRPLAEVTGKREAASHGVSGLGVYANTQGGSLRLKRAAKRRCVGRQERPGADAETTEWIYETLDTSKRYASAAMPGLHKIAPISIQKHLEHENLVRGSLNRMPSQLCMLDGMNGTRGVLQNDMLPAEGCVEWRNSVKY